MIFLPETAPSEAGVVWALAPVAGASAAGAAALSAAVVFFAVVVFFAWRMTQIYA